MLFIDSFVLNEIDGGSNIRKYDAEYWQMELPDAKERAYGVALARTAEVIYYTRIPIERFIDVGAGPGYFLDAISRHLPSHSGRFYGVELFPPPVEHRTKHQNYMVGSLKDVPFSFDSGLCMEVIEHLSPRMLRSLLEEIAHKSRRGACYIFNTGLPEYVLREDPNYLDPKRRGHVISWSVSAVRALCAGLEFDVFPIRGKTWAFILERRLNDGVSAPDFTKDIRERVWSALPENLELLMDRTMGSVLKILGHHTILAFS